MGCYLRETRWIVVGRRLLGRSMREAAVGRLVKSGGLVVQGPCRICLHMSYKN
jgi:hypothetical protein